MVLSSWNAYQKHTPRYKKVHSGLCSGAPDHRGASNAEAAGITADESAEVAAATVEPNLVRTEKQLFVRGASRGPSVGSEAKAGTKPRKKRRRKLDWQRVRRYTSNKVTAALTDLCGRRSHSSSEYSTDMSDGMPFALPEAAILN